MSLRSLRTLAPRTFQRRRRRARESQAAVHLALQLRVGRILADAESMRAAGPLLLQAICETYGWDWGEFWQSVAEKRSLQRWTCWHVANERLDAFERRTSGARLEAGVGIVGRAFEEDRVTWVGDLQTLDSVRLGAISAAGMNEGVAFPVYYGGAVVCFYRFASSGTPPSKGFVEAMGGIRRQVELFLHGPPEPRTAAAATESERGFEESVAPGGVVAAPAAEEMIGDVSIDRASHGLRGPAGVVALTRMEWRLLCLLFEGRGHVVAHEQLLKQGWGPEYSSETPLLHDTISRLRRRLSEAGLRDPAIQTMHGVGYRLRTQT